MERKVYFYTLGCKVNQYDSEIYREDFCNVGFEISNNFKDSDVAIINSCVVTEKAERDSIKLLRNIKKKSPETKIVLTGCLATLEDIKKNKLREEVIEYADLVVPLKDRKDLVKKVLYILKNEAFMPSSFNLNEYIKREINNFEEHTRAYIKIQEGCDNFCSYCIVPFLRGNSLFSKPVDMVIDEAKKLTENGFKEIVLTGTEISKYKDENKGELLILLKELSKIEKLKRIRISSINPDGLNKDLLDEVLLNRKLAKHLHISLQSGDDTILKKMKRPYILLDFLQSVNYLRKFNPIFSITADIIVGFPYEDEEAFLNSLEIVKNVQFSKLHIFPYSPRPLTLASGFKQTDLKTIKEREKRLFEVYFKTALEFKRNFVGKNLTVLVEEDKEDIISGLSSEYIRVKGFKKGEFARKNLHNEFVEVRIESVLKEKELLLSGKILDIRKD